MEKRVEKLPLRFTVTSVTDTNSSCSLLLNPVISLWGMQLPAEGLTDLPAWLGTHQSWDIAEILH